MSRLLANTGRIDGTVSYPSNQCVVGVWFKRSAAATDVLIHFGIPASAEGFYLQITSGGVLQAVVGDASAVSASSTTTISDTTLWHHGAMRVTDTGAGALKVEVWLDGAGKGTQALTRTPSLATAVRIGCNLNGTGFFSGRIDHPARWTDLTDAEIVSLAANIPSDVRRENLRFYDPLVEDRSPEIDDIGGVSLALTNATFDTDNPPIGPPHILSIGTVQSGASLTITGGVLKPGATNPTVTMGGVTQTVNSASDTSITINAVARGNAKYGDQAVVVTNSLGLSDSITVPFLPPSGWAFVDLVDPLALLEQRYATIPELADGDQITYGNVQGGTISQVRILQDASHFEHEDVTDYDVQVWDGTWGSVTTQSFEEPLDPPELVTGTRIPNIPFLVGVALNRFVGDYATGWTSAAIQGTAPGWLDIDGGTLVGTPDAAGVYRLQIRYANAAGHVDSNIFVLTFGVIRTRELVTSQSSPRRRRFPQ